MTFTNESNVGHGSTLDRKWPFQIRAELPKLGAFTIGEDFAHVLVSEALKVRPRFVLEAGSGVSTVLLGYCLQYIGSGHVYSLEHLPEYAQSTRKLLSEHGVERYATVLDAPLRLHQIGGAQWWWYDAEVGSKVYDLVVADGPPRRTGTLARYPILPLFSKQLSPTATILLDDADRADEEVILRRWAEEFPEFSIERFRTKKGAARLTAVKGL